MLSFQLTHFTLSNRIVTWSATWRNAGSGKVTGLNLAIAYRYLIMLNLPPFSGSMRHEIFIQPEFPKMTRPLRRFPKISKVFGRCSKRIPVSPRICFAKHNLASNAFLVKTLRFRRKYRHLLILHGVFVFSIG